MKPRTFVRYILKAFELWRILADSYGWRRSFANGKPIDGEGNPIPWYTYPAIEFLRTLDLTGLRIFEFGCGNSSRYWAQHAAEVHAVENDRAWATIVRNFGVENLHLHEANDEAEYVTTLDRVAGVFHVVIIDGRHRRSCVTAACRAVSDDGFIVFDNADWYPDACADLRALGWQQIDFSGPGPINPYCWTTAVFVRPTTRFKRRDVVHPIGGIRV
ncbi:MAG: class I SAM-dependent methyltransferase [Sulfuritalea sp.]|jgi:hypothetical protein|nr:class I SAM-dependent methyltransferase [Sulfuritalea sp.]